MKRFLQGLGAGILLTTLIFTISYYTVGNKKMSDKEIISAAQKLGMAQVTEAPLFNNAENAEDNIPEQNGEGTSETADNQQENAGSDGGEGENTDGTVPQEDAAGETSVQENTPQEGAAQEDTSQQQVQDDSIVQLTINEGDGATTVSQRLQELGVVSDAVDFDRYLRSNSQTHNIQIGTFELRKGMSYEEVSAIISSR